MTKSTKPIYVIGHRNPDTDSICSAIGYAHLKQALGFNAVPARAGKVNAETKYALEHFHVEQPLLLSDLYPRVKDVTLDCKIVVKQLLSDHARLSFPGCAQYWLHRRSGHYPHLPVLHQ